MDAAVLSVQKWLNETYKGKAGYNPISEDGITGWGTVKALTVALQIEEGIASPNGNFGPSTRKLCPTLSINSGTSNFVNILKGGLYCKGYEGGALDGKFTDRVKGSVMEFQSDAGLANPDGIVNAVIFKSLLTMDAFKLLNYGTYKGNLQIREIQQNLNRDYISNEYFSVDIGLVPCDGIYGRATNKALLYALQIEEGISVPNGVFGPSTKRLCPVLREGSTQTRFIKLLEYALYLNNYDPNNFSGNFNSDVKNAVIGFQKFTCLDADGVAGLSTWASLLVSSGNTNRKGNACDCAQTITEARAKTLKDNGYKYIGRYLTGKFKMTNDEVQTILNNGFKLFPIFEVGGYKNEYFTENQGIEDAKSAMKAANDLGFSENTIIYFAVDYDALEYQVKSNVLPYFKGVYETLKSYKVGIYAPRHVCSLVAQNGYSYSSFVCDMSTGFSGNLGYSLPNDWTFDQISTITLGSGDGQIEIDNDICSGKFLSDGRITADLSIEDANNSIVPKLLGIRFETNIFEKTMYCGPFEVTYKMIQTGIVGGEYSKFVLNGDGLDLEISKSNATGTIGLINKDNLKKLLLTPEAKSIGSTLYSHGTSSISFYIESLEPLSFNIEFETLYKKVSGVDIKVKNAFNIKYSTLNEYSVKSNFLAYILRLATVGIVIDQPVSIHFSYGVPMIETGMNKKWYADIVKKLIDAINGLNLGDIIDINAISPGLIKESEDFISGLIKEGSHVYDELIERVCKSNGVSEVNFKNNIMNYPLVALEICGGAIFVGVVLISLGSLI